MADPATPAGGAVKAAGGAFKRVPKWAWIASAGVAGGILYMKRTKKGEQVDQSAPQDATAPADYGQTGQAFTAGYVDVPYSGSPGAAQDNSVDIPSLIGALGTFIPQQPPPVQIPDVLAALAPFVGGGAPIATTTTVGPAPATAAPTPPPPVPAKAPDPCTGEFPFKGPDGCYKVVCASGKGDHAKGRWHFYKSGKEVRVSPTC